MGVGNQISTKNEVPVEDLYRLKFGAIWKAFTNDNFAFWMCCAYLFFEYVRPQGIWIFLQVYPYWARTFILLAFVGWVLNPKRQFVWNKYTTGIFVYLVLVILSSQFAYWPEISWERFIDYFNMAVVFFVLTQTVTTRHRFFILMLIFLIASFKLSFYGARTFAMRGFSFTSWGLAGPQGPFQNPGELAIQMIVFAPMSLFFVNGIKSFLKRWQVYVLYLMPITAAVTIIGTNTRGGQLALATQVVALILTTKHRIKTLVVIAIIGMASFQLLPAEQKARFGTSGEDLTSIQRLLYWKHGWQMIKDHPWLGIGYFNFPEYYTKHHYSDIILPMLIQRGRAELPHNIFIQVGTDTGFVGLAVFVGLMINSALSMRRLRRGATLVGDTFTANMANGLNLALLGYVVSGQFVTVAYYPYLWIHFVFISSMVTFCHNENLS
jgi:O-antigen ligase